MSAPKLTEAQVAALRMVATDRPMTAVGDGQIFAALSMLDLVDIHIVPTAKGRAYLATLDRERGDAMTTHPDSDRRG